MMDDPDHWPEVPRWLLFVWIGVGIFIATCMIFGITNQ